MPTTPGGRFSPGDADEWDLTTDLAAMQVSNETATGNEIAAAIATAPQNYRTGTNAQRLSIPVAERFEGLTFYVRENKTLWVFDGGAWKNRSRAIASYVTNTPAPAASYTPSFNAAGRVVDTHGFWTSGSPTRLTAPFTGLYEFSYSLRTNGVAAMTCVPRVNGAINNDMAASSSGVAGAATHTVFSGIITLNANDYIDLPITYGSTSGSGTYRIQLNYLGEQ